MANYPNLHAELKTAWDYVRFAVSEFNRNEVYFGHGTDNPLDEALALVMSVLKLPYDLADKAMTSRLSMAERKEILHILERRINERLPLPYLTHTAYFCGLPFYVDETVLIPRSPIAEIIENQFTPWIVPERVMNVLDLCTGSGCIALAIANEFPFANVDASDISSSALKIAKKNQNSLNLPINLIESDVFASIPPKKYDIIVSNPPYVCFDEMATLPAEYNHEPKMALEAEDNGLFIVDKILHQAKDYLAENGILIVEVGNSEEALLRKYPTVPFVWLEFERGGQGVFLLTYQQLLEHF